jgi:hypothetical protein
MRVALRAQAQCRSTFKSLAEFKLRGGRPRAVLHKIPTNRLLKARKAPHDQALGDSSAHAQLWPRSQAPHSSAEARSAKAEGLDA